MLGVLGGNGYTRQNEDVAINNPVQVVQCSTSTVIQAQAGLDVVGGCCSSCSFLHTLISLESARLNKEQRRNSSQPQSNEQKGT